MSGGEGDMKKGGLETFGAYRKSLELFDLLAKDMETLKGEYSLSRLVSQQLASADSICSNIEERLRPIEPQ